MKEGIDYHAKAWFNGNTRLFGGSKTGLFWEEMQAKYPDKTIILVLCYSDATQFFKGTSAWPIFGKYHCVLAHAHVHVLTHIVFMQ